MRAYVVPCWGIWTDGRRGSVVPRAEIQEGLPDAWRTFILDEQFPIRICRRG